MRFEKTPARKAKEAVDNALNQGSALSWNRNLSTCVVNPPGSSAISLKNTKVFGNSSGFQ